MKKVILGLAIIGMLSVGAVADTDSDSNALITIDTFHSKIHKGQAYSWGETMVVAGNIVTSYIISTSSTEELHFVLSFNGTASATVSFAESPTYAGGTPGTWFNRDRGTIPATYTNLASQILTSPTMTSEGTTMESFSYATATGTLSPQYEWVLAKNNKYLLKVLNGSTANTINTRVFVYRGDAR